MIEYAQDYDVSVDSANMDKKEANRVWDELQSTGCCGFNGPEDWKSWGKSGPPSSCCSRKDDVDSNNVCTKPFTTGCGDKFMEIARWFSILARAFFIIAIFFSLIALFLGLLYYFRGVDAGRDTYQEVV